MGFKPPLLSASIRSGKPYMTLPFCERFAKWPTYSIERVMNSIASYNHHQSGLSIISQIIGQCFQENFVQSAGSRARKWRVGVPFSDVMNHASCTPSDLIELSLEIFNSANESILGAQAIWWSRENIYDIYRRCYLIDEPNDYPTCLLG